MQTDLLEPRPAVPLAPALCYDELPEGSELRRQYDGRGGVTITAPAGELTAPVRRAIHRASLLPATAALGACLILAGGVVVQAAQNNRLDPSLRTAAFVTLGVLCAGVFLFVWVTHSIRLSHATADARRTASVIHADAARLLVETSGAAGSASLDIPTGSVVGVELSRGIADSSARSVAVACVKVHLRDGSEHVLLGGHHPIELQWVTATLSVATGIPTVTAPPWFRVPKGPTWWVR